MGQRQPRVTADEIIKVLKSLGYKKIDQMGSLRTIRRLR